MRRMIKTSKDAAVVDGIRTRPLAAGWLQKRAADRLGFRKSVLEAALSSDAIKNVKTYTRRQTFDRMTPELRWAMALTIRRSSGAFVNRLRNELAAAACLSSLNLMRIETVTTEDLFDDADEDEIFALHRDEGWRQRVSTGFTGDLKVIIDMEDSVQDDVDLMIDWIRDVGAWRLFGSVDGPTAWYEIGGGSVARSPYPRA